MKKYFDDGTCIILPDSLVELIESHTTKHMNFTLGYYVPQTKKEE